MKIAYYAAIRLPTPKAHGIQIMKSCESMARLGHDVTLVVPHRRNTISQDPFLYYHCQENFRIRKIPAPELIDWGRTGFLVQTAFFGILASLHALFKQPNIVYSRDDIVAYFLTFTRVPLYFEVHVNRYNAVMKRILKRATKIISISNGLKKFYLDKGALAQRIVVAPSGVEIKDFNLGLTQVEARKKVGLPAERVFIGYAGTLKTMGVDKGVITIMKALSQLPLNFSLLVVGGAPEEIGEYSMHARNLNVEDRVIFKERVPTPLLALYQQACDVLAMPFPGQAHYVEFMSPVKMFEYMASRRPILASDLPSIREVLNEENAYFFLPGDAHSFAEQMRSIVNDSALVEQKCRKALDTVASFSWEKRIEKFL